MMVGRSDIAMLIVLAVISICTHTAWGQENAGASVAASLRECYNTTELLDRDSRPPSTIGTLIDLIRKVENGRSAQAARTLSLGLIHRFRQDGIVRSPNSNEDVNVPYSPAGLQANKNIILLKQLIIADASLFPNETLNSVEKCSMHFMLSNTVETKERGDENYVCSRVSRFTKRERRQVVPKKDVEVLEKPPLPAGNGGRGAAGSPKNGVFHNSIPIDQRSKCPIESGVIWTKWGAVQAGSVLAGIATGISNQIIPIDDLRVDAQYATTLSGDLVEASLYSRSEMQIGVSGNWNSTVAPRYYFISNTERYEMTDADIRGGLDGLIIAQQINQWLGRFNTLKISQVLDMYYSQRGVFNSKYKACNRAILLTDAVPSETLKEQTNAFARLFNNHVRFDVSLDNNEIETFTRKAVDALYKAVPQLNDLACIANEQLTRVAADILIVLDTSWPYENISPALSYLLENVDVNPYDGSTYKIVNSQDGRVIVDTNQYASDFYQLYNRTVHDQHPNGFNGPAAVEAAESWLKTLMDNSSVTSLLGGRSQIILYVPFRDTNIDNDQEYLEDKKEYMKMYLPGSKTFVLANGNLQKYEGLVTSITLDGVLLDITTDSSAIINSIKSLITKFQKVHRNIVNPKCRSDWSGGGDRGTNSDIFHVEPSTVNYYRIAPHYFHGSGERLLVVRGTGAGAISVCGSRTVDEPRTDQPRPDEVECKEINADEFRVDLDGFCTGALADCTPYYLSVESSKPNDNNFRCREAKCRFPDNIAFTVSIDNFQCRSGAVQHLAGFLLVTLAMVLRNVL